MIRVRGAALVAMLSALIVPWPARAIDPARLPAYGGVIDRFVPDLAGNVSTILLRDGSELLMPPWISAALLQGIRPGDAVEVRGLKAWTMPLIEVVALTDQATGASVRNPGEADLTGARPATASGDAAGTIKTILHGRRGQIVGALLEDGTVLRFGPAATAHADLLVPGKPVRATGRSAQTPLGRVVEAGTVEMVAPVKPEPPVPASVPAQPEAQSPEATPPNPQ